MAVKVLRVCDRSVAAFVVASGMGHASGVRMFALTERGVAQHS